MCKSINTLQEINMLQFYCALIILLIQQTTLQTYAQTASHNQERSEKPLHSTASKNPLPYAPQIKIVLQDWTDSSRNRTIPIKLYIPSKRASETRFPIVIFSHGLGGSREAAQYLGEYWASKGYASVFVQHAGSDTSVWAKEGQLNRETFMANMRSAANGKNLMDRVEDVRFVIDELNRSANKSLFDGNLDLDQIAVAGHSFGAGTSLALAGQNFGVLRENQQFWDKRIKAAIYLCPPVIGVGRIDPAKAYGTIRIPGMLLTGTEDNAAIGDTTAEQRRLPFDGIKAPHQFLINFYGADHATFGGRSFRQAKSSDGGFHEKIQEVTGKFLDATLRNDPSAWKWLEADGLKNYLSKAAQVERK